MTKKMDLHAEDNAEMKNLIISSGIPDYTSPDLTVDRLDAIFRNVYNRRAAANSYLLNRLHVWLTETEPKFMGNSELSAEWSKTSTGVVSCLLTDTQNNNSWKVEWSKKYSTDTISVFCVEEDQETLMIEGSFYDRESGELKDRNVVLGGIEYPKTFNDVVLFAQTIAHHISEDIIDKKYKKDSYRSFEIPSDFKSSMLTISLYMAFDNGLPGRTVNEHIQLASAKANIAISEYFKNKFDSYVEKLESIDAEWGKNCLSIRGDNAHACMMKSDNAKAIFYADHSTCSDENIGLIVIRGDTEKTLEVYLFENNDDIENNIVASFNGDNKPRHLVNLKDMSSETILTDDGQDAMKAMGWWLITIDILTDEDMHNIRTENKNYWNNASLTDKI